MKSISIGGLAQHYIVVLELRYCRAANHQLLLASHVAGEQHAAQAALVADLHQNAAGAENMSRGKVAQTEVLGHMQGLRFVHRAESVERGHGVVISVER